MYNEIALYVPKPQAYHLNGHQKKSMGLWCGQALIAICKLLSQSLLPSTCDSVLDILKQLREL